MTITVVEVNRVVDFPPVINLIRVLLDQNHVVKLISRATDELPEDLKKDKNLFCFEIPWINENNILNKFLHRIKLNSFVRKKTKDCMKDSDILWTTSIVTIRELRKDVHKYKHVFQLMELTRYGYLTRFRFKFSLAKIARSAYKVVCPEINRAYIEKVWWNLQKTPSVLPNKPYSIEPGPLGDDIAQAISRIKSEKRKVILYLGGVFSDRNLKTVAEAVSRKEGYVLYIVGRTFSDAGKRTIDELVRDFNVEYLGGFNPPSHLHFLKYSYIGVLPYKPVKTQSSDELNALYCAPNKIFEYAGYGIPMIGSDVLGLKMPFEKWNIGFCYMDDSVDSILAAINKTEENYYTMKKNCLHFYDSINLDAIVKDIIGEN